jgi:hypothetical protein
MSGISWVAGSVGSLWSVGGLAAEKVFSVHYMATRLGEATRKRSAAPIRRFLERLGLRFDVLTDETYLMAAATIAYRLLN